MSEDPMKLLLVEDEDDFRDSCFRWMQRKGHQVFAAASGADALSLCSANHFEVAVFDMNMPGMSGMELLQRVRQDGMAMEIVILTGQGTIDMAVEAMKLGASDFLTKPCTLGDLEHRCRLARDRGKLRRENANLKALISRNAPTTDLVGQSAAMGQVAKMIQKVAPTDKPVLLQGESGTGKEVVARQIQQHSRRAGEPFVTINCAALPEQLVESELFGHSKGSFTGAIADKPGLFEIADRGTLFIDEVGELPLSLQPKLLRVLEDGSLRRIGSAKETHVDVRIIAATHRNLHSEVAAGTFREDLFYRINVLTIPLPALRERTGDIDLLVDHFIDEGWHLDEPARQAFHAYHWPGNVRQLINVIQRAMIMADGNEVTLDDLPAEMGAHAPIHPLDERPGLELPQELPMARQNDALADTSAPLLLEDVIKTHVRRVLNSLGGNKSKAARALGIHRRKLYRLLDRYDDSKAGDQEDHS